MVKKKMCKALKNEWRSIVRKTKTILDISEKLQENMKINK